MSSAASASRSIAGRSGGISTKSAHVPVPPKQHAGEHLRGARRVGERHGVAAQLGRRTLESSRIDCTSPSLEIAMSGRSTSSSACRAYSMAGIGATSSSAASSMAARSRGAAFTRSTSSSTSFFTSP
jgi:hypothetical protein